MRQLTDNSKNVSRHTSDRVRMMLLLFLRRILLDGSLHALGVVVLKKAEALERIERRRGYATILHHLGGYYAQFRQPLAAAVAAPLAPTASSALRAASSL